MRAGGGEETEGDKIKDGRGRRGEGREERGWRVRKEGGREVKKGSEGRRHERGEESQKVEA